MKQPDPNLQDTLVRLNQIGAFITNLGSNKLVDVEVEVPLRLIVQSAIEVVPGSSAVLYTYDESSGKFNPASRFSAEKNPGATPDDFPRPDGIGARAIAQRRRVLSYEEPDLQIHPGKQADGARVMSCFPLIVANEIFGVLYLYLNDDRQFTALELLMLENFVYQAALTLSLARQLILTQQEQEQKNRELRRLRRAGSLITSRMNLQETLQAILTMALEVMDAQYGIFRLVDDNGTQLVMQAFVGEGLSQPALEPLLIDRNSIMGIVALDHQPLVISDLREPPWSDVYYPLDRSFEMRSELAVPLLGAGERLEGVLNIESPQTNAFNKQDRYILQILATQAVSAIQQARLLDALKMISSNLLTLTLQEMLDYLATQARNLLNAADSAIWILEEAGLTIRAATFEEPLPPLSLDNSLTNVVLQTNQLVSVQNIQQDSRFIRPEFAQNRGWGSMLIVPIRSNDEQNVLGTFEIYTRITDLRDFAASDWDEKVLLILSHYTSLALLNATRLEELRTIQEQNAVTETFAAVGDIAANLMHRLNNKVGLIPARIEGIQDKFEALLDGYPYLANSLEAIEESASEAMHIVRDSLFHIRPVQLTAVRIVDCVEQAITSADIPFSLFVEYSGLEKLPPVTADRERLVLIFINLLENAADAMNGHGHIWFSGQDLKDRVEIMVADSGPGIPPDLHERIFEQAFSGQSERPGKLGFGLWWVKTLMVRMGGSIAVKSDGKPGTTFILRFPRGRS